MTTSEFSLFGTVASFDPAKGFLALKIGGREIGQIHAAASLAIDGKTREISLFHRGILNLEERGDLKTLTIHVDHGWIQSDWSLKLREGDFFHEIDVRLYDPKQTARIETIRSFSVAWSDTPLAHELDSSRWWVFPSSGWDQPGTRPLKSTPHPEDCPSIAFDIAGAYAPSGNAITLGHLLPSRWINRMDATATHLQINSTIGANLHPHESVSSDSVLLDVQRPIVMALAAIGERHYGRRQAIESAHHWGWNTWDYFTDKVVESDVAKAVEVISSYPWMKAKMRYIIVDDSWQNLTGDWLPGDRYGSIERSIKTIQEAGYLPGVWSAPFMVDRHSDLMKEHPEYVLKLKDGQMYGHCPQADPPWGNRFYLDPTHPGVVEHIFHLYRRLFEMGFRYFKTDFLTNSISPEFPGENAKLNGQLQFHNPDMGIVRAHRTCMEAIRAAIGPDSFWLGCGTHYASGAGIMDATRISADMQVNYPSVLSCARSAIFNFHLHGGPFLIDPDFAIFRGRETSKPGMLNCPPEGIKPYDRLRASGPTFDLNEARLWAAVLIMSGGAVILSDRLDGLNDAGLSVIRTLLEHGGGTAAIPLDLFVPLPAIWRKQHQNSPYLLVANWSEETAECILPETCNLKPGTVLEDIWTREKLSYASKLSLKIPAHGHRLLKSQET